MSNVSVAPQISGLLSLAFATTSAAFSLSYPMSQKVWHKPSKCLIVGTREFLEIVSIKDFPPRGMMTSMSPSA